MAGTKTHISSTSTPDSTKQVSVMLASPLTEDHIALRDILRHSKWELRSAWTFSQAVSILRSRPPAVAICESRLPDNRTWQELFEEILRLEHPPALIVTDRLADDHLWAEVLNLGGYDVLVKPFDPQEVFRVVSIAWSSWKSKLLQPNARKKPPKASTPLAAQQGRTKPSG